MEREKLCNAIKTTAWAYVLLHLNINLGTLNLLPDWLGYLLLLKVLPVLGKEEPSALLLRPLNLLLAAWAGILWLTALFKVSSDIPLLFVLDSVISLYFHFQLLTNLAEIAGHYYTAQKKQLLTLRTVRTLLITILALPFPWQRQPHAMILIVIANLAIAVWICISLFSLNEELKKSV